MDELTMMIAWEQGTLSFANTVRLFQGLIDSGKAWTLQGCYGRAARQLILSGWCSIPVEAEQIEAEKEAAHG